MKLTNNLQQRNIKLSKEDVEELNLRCSYDLVCLLHDKENTSALNLKLDSWTDILLVVKKSDIDETAKETLLEFIEHLKRNTEESEEKTSSISYDLDF